MNTEIAYLQTMDETLKEGVWQKNDRTGEECCTIDGAITRFDLRLGFPAITTKKLAFKAAVGELVGFIRGVTSAADFRLLGCKVWDQNANENQQWLANPFRLGEDDLGEVYGAQWRRWQAFKRVQTHAQNEKWDEHEAIQKKLEAEGWECIADTSRFSKTGNDIEDIWYKEIDQLGDCVRKLICNPSDRRILFHGWNPAKLDEIALPACHLLYQFLPNVAKRELNMTIYIRSWDLFLGGPFNITEGALFIELIARLTGFTPGRLTIMSGDTHIYEKHLPQVQEQLSREPYEQAKLLIHDAVPTYADLWHQANGEKFDGVRTHGEHLRITREKCAELAVAALDNIEPEHFELIGYRHHDPLPAVMAV